VAESEPALAGAAVSRPRLSRELVLDAAVRLADRDGLAGFSMRHLAREVGAEAMSLYHYVPNKDELLAGMLDRILEEMTACAPADDWRASVKAAMISRRMALQRHPWAADLQFQGPLSLTGARLRHMEALLATLHAAGFTGALADHAYHAIDISVQGFTLWEARFDALTRAAPDDLAEATLAGLSRDAWPEAAGHIEFHLQPPEGERISTFELSLDLLLEGLERLRLGTTAPGAS